MKSYKHLFALYLLFTCCTPKKDVQEMVQAYLDEKRLVADHTIDEELKLLLPGINCIAKTSGAKYFSMADAFNFSDTNQVLLIPFRSKNKIGTSSGFSDLQNRVVFICPLQIKDFVSTASLSDSAGISGYLGIVLIHELSHFVCGVPGNFDEDKIQNPTSSRLGEQDMGTEPVLMTQYKRLELKVDSTAIQMIKRGIKITQGDCFSSCIDIELAIGGAEFMMFGTRTLDNFGTKTPNFLKDRSLSHPNLELRLGFMNYYLNPTDQKREQIDNYIYEREVAPVNRQLTDPRIFQGEKKILPDN